MSMTLRALSALLSYPTAELQAHVGEIRAVLEAEAAVPRKVRARLEPLLCALETEDLLDLQAAYCELFDQSRALSLHLFEHVHGDSRERGQAMIDLGQQYVDRGFVMSAPELPDYLPLFLEFLSCLPPAEAREWLGQPVHVLTVLERRLAERGSGYAAVFQALVVLSGVRPDPDDIARLQARIRTEAAKSVDQEWEDAPVDFSAPVPETGSVFARFRAARQALSSAIKG